MHVLGYNGVKVVYLIDGIHVITFAENVSGHIFKPYER